jgi:hypothetical protein
MSAFLNTLHVHPESIQFADIISHIAQHYDYSPTRFTNGEVVNEAGKNEGSCKIFAFARLQGLGEMDTLALFGQYYRDDVLKHPSGNDHANIRTFMQHGWKGIHFDGVALTPKAAL